MLQEELNETNRGLLALTMEVEKKNEEVQAINQQLLQAARLATMGELAASIAHELNNPLTTLSLRVESLVAQISPDDPKQRTLKIISSEIDRMATLISELLDFSRRKQRQVSTVNVCQEIEDAVELISYHFRSNRIRVICDFQSSIPMIYGDHQELRQLFINLFTNAIDAMPEGGTLTIQVNVEHAQTDWVAIHIKDTGIGIKPQILSKVTEPFYSTKPDGKGTGLGLPICSRIVTDHHGVMNITSNVDQGTTVSIKIPYIDN
jgi:signal transduction histidine kinase